MANSLLTPTVVLRELLMQVKNNLVMGSSVNRVYEKNFTGGQGDSVTIRRPVKFTVSDGATLGTAQDIEEGSTTVTVDQRKHIHFEVLTQDMTLSIQDFSKRYLESAAISMANVIDKTGHELYKKVWNHVGTPGTTPSTFDNVAEAGQRLDEMAVPSRYRRLMVSPAASRKLAGTATALYMDSVAKAAYRRGAIGEIDGFTTYKTQNVVNHTVGDLGGTPLVNGASQNVTYNTAKDSNSQTLDTDGWSASTSVLNEGDVFTIAGVYAVNPVPGAGSTGKTVMPYLQEFVVRSDVTSDGSGAATITISPAIITSGPYQTVSAAPADNAAITIQTGTASTAYPQHLAFHRDAFSLVMVPLKSPAGNIWSGQLASDGLSFRIVKDYSISSDKDIFRVDALFGWDATYPDLACRITG